MAVNKDINCVIEYKKGDLNSKVLEKFYKNLEKHSVTVGIHSDVGSKQVGNGIMLFMRLQPLNLKE